jgi:hypothetical protein
MRRSLVSLTLIVGAGPAMSAELSDTMQRAAYCSGVIGYHIATFKPNENVPPDACRSWEQDRFPSRDACLRATYENVLEAMHRKLQRYTHYIKLGLWLRSDPNDKAMMSVAIIRSKGRRDAEAMKMGPLPPHLQRCQNKCGTELQCYVKCAAEQLPTEAAVLRCALLPDELPY